MSNEAGKCLPTTIVLSETLTASLRRVCGHGDGKGLSSISVLDCLLRAATITVNTVVIVIIFLFFLI